MAIDPLIKAGSLTEGWNAILVFDGTVVHAILVFGGASFITKSSTLISQIKAVPLTHNRTAVIVLISALILALLIKAVFTLIFACKLVLHAFGLSKNWNTGILFIDAIINALLIFSGAVLIAE
jgi:hypothetical protein